ncbi:MAG: hypothetical protein A2Y40_08980 [Candidatus Margulisbacteria bacterium GWF2_35_9]|nr:MAG: hypothetical protein A2Y40_08980 [Candidatus Margulisbacteria bacterium GWF2_35_9]
MKSKNILYIGDNTGEIVFDKILVEELQSNGCQVTYTVKSSPILNDALMEDATATGMTTLTHVIESGSTTAGTLISQGTDEFIEYLNKADLIISKGQGNLETISEESLNKPVFYLLLSKCNHISKALGIKKFDLILMHDTSFKSYLKQNQCLWV